eukprot:11121932-Lingulodinium_polyedra.AAC.1
MSVQNALRNRTFERVCSGASALRLFAARTRVEIVIAKCVHANAFCRQFETQHGTKSHVEGACLLRER